MNKVKPFLKWAGSKYRCIEHILDSLPAGKRLIEPFTGSGAVFINTNKYAHYLLAEGNGDLISLFKYIKLEGHAFINFCAEFFIPVNNAAEQYYKFRQEFNVTKEPRLRAALFLYLNRHGYNGLCRYNQSGHYNVPFGRYIKPYFPYNELLHFYQKSQIAEFIESDFRQTFLLAGKGDVIYCDPPYVPLSLTSSFSSYTYKKFSLNDQIELANLAQQAANKGVTVIISNHDTEFTREHYQAGEIISFPVQRLISCKANKRQPVQELIAIFR